MTLVVVLSVVIWFVFGYFGTRMVILEQQAFWGHDASRTLMVFSFFGGLITWILNMGPGVMSGDGVRRKAHFIPLTKRFGPNSELIQSWFGVKR